MVFHRGIRSALLCPFRRSAHVQLNPQEAGTEKVPLPLRALGVEVFGIGDPEGLPDSHCSWELSIIPETL